MVSHILELGRAPCLRQNRLDLKFYLELKLESWKQLRLVKLVNSLSSTAAQAQKYQQLAWIYHIMSIDTTVP